jgi:hypothetical protein
VNIPAPQPQPGIPPAPPRTPELSSNLVAGVQRLIAFLLRWSGALSPLSRPQTRELVEALQLLSTLIERYGAGAQGVPRASTPCASTPADACVDPSARLPRSERRELLTPGIYAGLFFTRLAAIAARARCTAIAARRRRDTPRHPPISIFALSGRIPMHALFVTIS